MGVIYRRTEECDVRHASPAMTSFLVLASVWKLHLGESGRFDMDNMDTLSVGRSKHCSRLSCGHSRSAIITASRHCRLKCQ